MKTKIFIAVLVGLAAIILIFGFCVGKCSTGKKQQSASASSKCASDFYDCSDFKNQEEAQKVFDACYKEGAGDIHRLDYDNNKIACESLDKEREAATKPDKQKKAADDACQGCCSGHDGVICKNGKTTCKDGTPLSEACKEKGCNDCN